MLRLGAIPAAAFPLSMVRAPESPRFLIQAGKTEEGFAVLEHIIGTEQARLRTDDMVVPEFLRTLVFARPRGDDQFADCTFSPSLDMSR